MNLPPLARSSTFAQVQGVFFRKYTQLKAKELGVVGWCRNTESGTVKGEAQGSAAAVEHFKSWVENEGSPHSYISNCLFKKERPIEALDYPDFSIRR